MSILTAHPICSPLFRCGWRSSDIRLSTSPLEMCLSVLRWLLDVIDNVNFHDALLRFHSQTHLSEHLKYSGSVGDVRSGSHCVHPQVGSRFEVIKSLNAGFIQQWAVRPILDKGRE